MANTVATFKARVRQDKNGKIIYFAGGKKSSRMVDLSKVVMFIFPEEDDSGQIMKVVLCEGSKTDTDERG
jgi:hypothetical protein